MVPLPGLVLLGGRLVASVGDGLTRRMTNGLAHYAVVAAALLALLDAVGDPRR